VTELRAASSEYAASLRELDDLLREGSIDNQVCAEFKKGAKEVFDAKRKELQQSTRQPPSSQSNDLDNFVNGDEENEKEALEIAGGGGGVSSKSVNKPDLLQIQSAVEVKSMEEGGEGEGAVSTNVAKKRPAFFRYLSVFFDTIVQHIVDGADGAMLFYLHVREYRRVKMVLYSECI